MKKIFFIFIFFILQQFLFSQWVKKSNGLDTTKVIFGFIQSGTNIYNCNYGGDFTGGVFLSTNSGNNWTAVNSGMTHTSVLSLASSGNNFYAGTYGGAGGIFRSTNYGTNWILSGLSGHRIWSLCIKGTDVLAGTEWGGLYRSSDNGISWAYAGLSAGFIFSIASSNDNIFAGTRFGVYRSTDNGSNWTNVLSLGLDVNSVAINGSSIFVGTSGLAGVYKSTNNGTNWTASNSGMTHNIVTSFAFSGYNVFAGTINGGFYVSTNDGINWHLKTEGTIPPFNVNCLIIANNYIYAGTGSQSVWRRPLSDLIVPLSPSLINPLNNSVNQPLTINFRWTKLQIALKYKFLLSTDSLFTNVIINDSLLTDTLRNVSNLNPSTNYYWKVSAGNTAGWSNYSSTWKFTTVPPVPAAPVLTYPLNNSSGISITTLLDWDSLTTANSYQTLISTDSLFGNIVWDTAGIVNSFVNVRSGILTNNIKYYWKVRGINQGGTGVYSQTWAFTTSLVNITYADPKIPSVFKLYDNYPNPFNPVTKIRFDVPRSDNVKIVVYDMLGRNVVTLVNQQLLPGTYETEWNAENHSSGIYFCKMLNSNFSKTVTLILLK